MKKMKVIITGSLLTFALAFTGCQNCDQLVQEAQTACDAETKTAIEALHAEWQAKADTLKAEYDAKISELEGQLAQ